MSEKAPDSSRTPEQPRIDQEFYSATSRWFNSNREELLATAGGKEEDENFAYHQDQLKDEVTLLAQPKLLESKIQRDGTAEKYGVPAARAMSAADGMAMLGSYMSRIEEIQRMHDDPNDHGVKEVYAKEIQRNKEAKELFMKASEKVFTPSSIADPNQEVTDIVKTYERATKEPGTTFLGSLGFDFEYLSKSVGNPTELKKELTNTIERLGSQLGQQVYYSVEGKGDLSVEEENTQRQVLAAGNKMLFRLVSVQGKLAQ